MGRQAVSVFRCGVCGVGSRMPSARVNEAVVPFLQLTVSVRGGSFCTPQGRPKIGDSVPPSCTYNYWKVKAPLVKA